MLKKITPIIAILLISNILLVSNSTASDPGDKIIDKFSELLKINSELEISTEEEYSNNDFIIPPESNKTVNINVKYKVNLRPFLSNLLLKTKIGKTLVFKQFDFEPKINIKIIGESNVSWCYVKSKTKTVSVNVSNNFQEISTDFQIHVKPEAEAFKKAEITFTAQSIVGEWNIKDATDEIKINIISGCKVDIRLSCIHFDVIKPGETSNMPITVENNGNVETIVDVELANKLKTWDVKIDTESIKILPDGKKTVNVKIKTKSTNTKDEEARIRFTPRAKVDLDIKDKSFNGEIQTHDIELMGTNLGDNKSMFHGSPSFGVLLILIALIIVVLTYILIKKAK